MLPDFGAQDVYCLRVRVGVWCGCGCVCVGGGGWLPVVVATVVSSSKPAGRHAAGWLPEMQNTLLNLGPPSLLVGQADWMVLQS